MSDRATQPPPRRAAHLRLRSGDASGGHAGTRPSDVRRVLRGWEHEPHLSKPIHLLDNVEIVELYDKAAAFAESSGAIVQSRQVWLHYFHAAVRRIRVEVVMAVGESLADSFLATFEAWVELRRQEEARQEELRGLKEVHARTSALARALDQEMGQRRVRAGLTATPGGNRHRRRHRDRARWR